MEIIAWFGRVNPETGSFTPAEDACALADGLIRPPPAGDACLFPQPDLRVLALACGFASNDREYTSRLRERALELVRRQLDALATKKQDLLQAVEALDDLSVAVNLLDERLYEWSRLTREKVVQGRDLAVALSGDEITGVLARASLSLRESRRIMDEKVSAAASDIAPNLSSIAGPVLASRLISRAGGLKQLARMPASAIQVMGAEKSLFKHLKGHAPSPKHGLIYRHPAVGNAPRRQRGKTARALAGKLAIAARLDYYSAGLSPDLKVSLDKRLAEIKRSGSKRNLGER